MSNKVEATWSCRCTRANSLAGCTHVRLHDDVACDVIAAELVACTLGHRSRPELQADAPGRMIVDLASRGHRASQWLLGNRAALTKQSA